MRIRKGGMLAKEQRETKRKEHSPEKRAKKERERERNVVTRHPVVAES